MSVARSSAISPSRAAARAGGIAATSSPACCSSGASSSLTARGNGNAASTAPASACSSWLRWTTASAVLNSARGAPRALASAAGRRSCFWFIVFRLADRVGCWVAGATPAAAKHPLRRWPSPTSDEIDFYCRWAWVGLRGKYRAARAGGCASLRPAPGGVKRRTVKFSKAAGARYSFVQAPACAHPGHGSAFPLYFLRA